MDRIQIFRGMNLCHLYVLKHKRNGRMGVEVREVVNE